MLRDRSFRHRDDPGRMSGQTLVEFALVIPIFVSVLVAIVEFAFVFNAILATNFASRDAALAAAEAGNDMGADCVILQQVEADMGAPTSTTSIQQVQIYQADRSGNVVGSATIYARTGSFNCPMPDGSTVTLPYTRTQNGYPTTSRCNQMDGCGLSELALIGVEVSYRHTWRTPFGLTFGPYLDIVRSNSMRMEPIL